MGGDEAEELCDPGVKRGAGWGHRAAIRLEAGAGVWMGGGKGARLHLGAGSESGNQLASIVWGWTG